jgi:dTMP kinase
MRLIIVDGLDGVGKDTHARLIKNRYEQRGEKVIIRSHPESDTYFGRKTKQALLGHGMLNKAKASVFYMIDVLLSIRRFYWRRDVDTLIMVRYLMGTAYLPERLARIGYQLFEHFVPTSEYMFFLDAPSKNLLKRVKRREKREIFETLEELEKVRKKALLFTTGWFVIDTSGSIEETYADIDEILDRLDKKH